MSDDRRVYSDEEFALILHQAAELANRAEPGSSTSSGGLTLDEMKAVAAQVGVDPALVERAARMMVAKSTVSPFERFIGGALRHKDIARFPVKLDEQSAARLLSAVRISGGVAGSQDVGHSSSMGMTWHDGGSTESLGVSARADEDATEVSLVLDRRGTLVLVATFSGFAIILATLFAGSALYQTSHALGYAGLIGGVGGVLAAARAYWASSTRRARERIEVTMEAINKLLTQPHDPL